MDLKKLALIMIKYHEQKNEKQQPIPHEKKEKIRKPLKKKEKFNKTWFVDNAYNINMHDFLSRNGDLELDFKNIYSKYLVEKKGQNGSVNDELYEIVNNYYQDSIKPKRTAILD